MTRTALLLLIIGTFAVTAAWAIDGWHQERVDHAYELRAVNDLHRSGARDTYVDSSCFLNKTVDLARAGEVIDDQELAEAMLLCFHDNDPAARERFSLSEEEYRAKLAR